MKVALDLDSTLADTLLTVFDILDEPQYGYADSIHWDWPIEEFGRDRFLNAAWHVWSIRRDDIQPSEPDLRAKTDALKAKCEQLDVVTAHPDHLDVVDHGKQQWLDEHGVCYDDYVSVEGAKHALDYDVYIDDNPKLVEATNSYSSEVLLYDRPYNRDIDDERAIRVQSIADATRQLRTLLYPHTEVTY